MIISALQLMALQIETLFTRDAAGRMLRVNEPDGDPAPRFFLGRTAEGNIWRVRHDTPDDLARELDRICRAEPIVQHFEAPPLCLEAVRALLGDDAPASEAYRGPCFCFPPNLPDAPDALTLDERHALLLPPQFANAATPHPERLPVVGVLADGVIAAICFSSRNTPRACEAGVETLPAQRGRGLASIAVAGWAALVRQSGREPLYSTDWDNHASRGVARRLGLRLYGEDVSWG
jgi:hypothetical protein